MPNAKDAARMTPGRELLQQKENAAAAPRALDHLALSILVTNGSDWPEALAALARLRAAFVDWNETRVARVQELARALGDVPAAEKVAKATREAYNVFFDRKGALSFEFLADGKPTDGKKALGQLLPALHKGAHAVLLYEFCPGSPCPITDDALRLARKDGLVGKNADRNQLTRLLAEELTPAEAARLILHWEIAASGTPYGAAAKKEAAPAAGKKKAKPAPAKAKDKAAQDGAKAAAGKEAAGKEKEKAAPAKAKAAGSKEKAAGVKADARKKERTS